MFRIVDGFFRWQIRVREWMGKRVWKHKSLLAAILVGLLVILALCASVEDKYGNSSVFSWIIGGLLVLMVLLNALFSSEYAMTSARGFLIYGAEVIAVSSLLFVVVGSSILGVVLLPAVLITPTVLFWYSLHLGLAWTVYSLFCDAKSATFANGLLTGIVGLITITAEYVKTIVCREDFLEPLLSVEISADEIEQVSEIIEYCGVTFCYPVIFTLGLATLFCAVKQYWEEKYLNEEPCIKQPDADHSVGKSEVQEGKQI